MSSLNHKVLKGKAIRIMWCQRNPTKQMPGAANLFVKNLNPSIDSSHLESLFEKFGTVLSCKVAEENGISKGFGFVQFDKEDSAIAAINAMHDTVLSGNTIYVGQFMTKTQRIAAKEQKFTNLYVMNLDEDLTEDCLFEKFSEFGTVLNAVTMRDKEGKTKGFGFVKFESPEEARKAVEALNGTPLGLKNLFAGRAQKKPERNYLKERARAATVYIKNLDPGVTDEMLVAYFSSYGQVVSKKVVCHENGVSKGFGFVSFPSPAEAKRAIQTLAGSTLLGRRLYVSIVQNKEDRKRAASVYVKNLDPAVTDEMLAAHFSSCGEVVLKKVVRHENGVSKGFGFLGFSSPEVAKRAVQSLCGSTLLGRRLYVSIAQNKEPRKRALQEITSHAAPNIQAAPSVPRCTLYPHAKGISQVKIGQPSASTEEIQPQIQNRDKENLITGMTGVANLFVKNLGPAVDSTHWEAIFEKFGTALSCKVADDNGKSKGCRCFQFENEDLALPAINALHDTLAFGKNLYVAQFMRKSQRTTLLKNFDEEITQDSLLKKFSEFGTVQNAAIVCSNNVGEDHKFYVPNEVFESILQRVPGSDVVKLKGLSKYWNSVINSRGFVKAHADLALSRPGKLIIKRLGRLMDMEALRLLRDNLVYGFGRDDLVLDGFGRDDLVLDFFEEPYVVEICRGLIFVHMEILHTRIILNPCTRDKRVLPPFVTMINRYRLFGFGYLEADDDYKVVMCCFGENDACTTSVYSLKSNEWSVQEVQPPSWATEWYGCVTHTTQQLLLLGCVTDV